MRRRDAIAAFFLLSVTSPLSAQSKRRVGVVQGPGGNFARDKWAGKGFLAAMKELGYREGRDFVYEVREWQQPADDRHDILSERIVTGRLGIGPACELHAPLQARYLR